MPPRSANQLSLFPIGVAPGGFVFQPEIMSPAEEETFLNVIRQLSFGPFVMHGIEAKRRIANFGLRYTSRSGSLTAAPETPSVLEPLRTRAAALAGIAPSDCPFPSQ